MKDSNFKVGFIDSGHGGLDVLYHYRVKRGHSGDSDNLYYAADLAFMPYGSLSSEKIYERCADLCEEMLEQFDPDIFVIACNTATAHAIDQLRKNFEIPFVGVEPYLNYINKTDLGKNAEKGSIGALVTPSTFQAPRFKTLKEKLDPQDLVEVLAPKELASSIEKFILDQDRTALLKILQLMFQDNLPLAWKEVILGCTHYPLIKEELELVLKAKCISPTQSVVEQIFRTLGLDVALQQEDPKNDFTFSYCDTRSQNWRKARLSEFLPWYLI